MDAISLTAHSNAISLTAHITAAFDELQGEWGTALDEDILVADAVTHTLTGDDAADLVDSAACLLRTARLYAVPTMIAAHPTLDVGDSSDAPVPSVDGAVRGVVMFDHGPAMFGATSAIATAMPVTIDCTVTDALNAVRGDDDAFSRVATAAVTGEGAEFFTPTTLNERMGTLMARIDVWSISCVDMADYAMCRLLDENHDLDDDEIAALRAAREAIAATR